LEATAALWSAVRVGYHWGQQAADILRNEAQLAATAVRRRLSGLLGALTRYQATAGTLAPALGPFRKVTRRSWPGLVPCSTVPELPRTHHALEPFFGAYRSYDRRPPGRTVASPGLVLSGPVRVVAAAAPRLQPFSTEDLAPEDLSAWQALRQEQESRRQQRTLRRRFRQAPVSYLAKLEADLLQLILPP
jgi:hypothetical protein